MKITILLMSLVSFSAFSHVLNGKWSSKNISLISPNGDYENCTSNFEVNITSTLVSISEYYIQCESYVHWLDRRDLQIEYGGILYAYGSRGHIERDLVQFFTKVFMPDGHFLESKTNIKSISENHMRFHYLLENEYQKLEIEGDFTQK